MLPWRVSQAFSYSAGGTFPQAEWILSSLYHGTHSIVASITSPTSCQAPRVDELMLVKAVQRFRGSIVIRIAFAPDRPDGAISSSRSAYG